jgi:hypothetical protein
MAAIGLLVHLGTMNDLVKIARPMSRLLHGSREVQYTMLNYISTITKKWPVSQLSI